MPQNSANPEPGSHRRAGQPAVNLDKPGEATMERKKKRKKEPRPESIIIYRSESEKVEEDQDDPDSTAKSTEERTNFLTPPEGAWNVPIDSRYVTLTGTITRGKKKGQMVDIHVTLTEKELQELAKCKEPPRSKEESERKACDVGPRRGPHVVLWSLLCAPVIFVLSFVMSFYYGTIAWYNVFLVYNEERTFWHKVTVCPLLIILYPVLIMATSASLGLYTMVTQVSWSLGEWWQAVRDLEKGFCGWLCSKLGLEDCSPYSIVELLDSDNVSGSLSGKTGPSLDQTSAV